MTNEIASIDESWYTANDKTFGLKRPVRKADKLPPGLYSIEITMDGSIEFTRTEVKDTHLVALPDDSSEEILKEITAFWSREHIYRKFNVPYKRGLLMTGKPGTGKSSLIRLMMNELFKLGGIVLQFSRPELFEAGLNELRKKEPNTPVICLMEDIDSILEYCRETEVLNILDGVSKVDKVVFLATTNYPEQLEERFSNRPSRFDKTFDIAPPNTKSREIFLKSLFKVDESMIPKNIDKWVSDTEGLSIAHLHELFVNVIAIGTEYGKAIETLKAMGAKGTLVTDIPVPST